MSNDNIMRLSPGAVKFASIDEAITAISEGGFVIVADDENRENEGDLICAASLITPEAINFMLKEARGMVCVALSSERAETLDLYPMVQDNTDTQNTAFTISVDAGPEFGVTTGMSAKDRATTIQCLVSENAVADDFRRPGHVFPLIAKTGGVLRRVGHTEAAIDLARLAGLPAAGVICEIMNDDGSMARRDDLAAFAKKHKIPFITIAQLIQFRLETERFVVRKIAQQIDTKYGAFMAVGYTDTLNGVEHLALVKGDLQELAGTAPAVRIQHENLIMDVLGENDENNAQQMAAAMTYINNEGAGVVIYLRSKDGTPQSVIGSLKDYGQVMTKDRKRNTPDLRDYGVGAQILTDLGITQFRMITNNPKKIVALRGFGLDVVDTIAMPSTQTANSSFEFSSKIEKKFAAKNENSTVKPVEMKQPEKPVVAKIEPKAEPKVEQKPEEKTAELKAEPRMMRMGGQIISGQALFEG